MLINVAVLPTKGRRIKLEPDETERRQLETYAGMRTCIGGMVRCGT